MGITKVDSNIMSENRQKEELTKITASKYDPSLIRHSYITCNWINQSPASLSMLASKLYTYAQYRLNEDVFSQADLENRIDMDKDLEFCLSLDDFRNAFDWHGHGGVDYEMAEKAVGELAYLSISIRQKRRPGVPKLAGVIHLFPTALLNDQNYIYLRVNKSAFPYLMENRKNYTIYALEEMKIFSTNYAYQLYRHLKSYAFTPSWERQKRKTFRHVIPLNELRFMIGTSNFSPSTWKKISANQLKEIDYAKELELSIKSNQTVYPDWRDFNKFVLAPVVKEINQASALNVSYTTEKKGRGGSISAIVFEFSYKEDPKTSEDIIRLCAAKLSGIAEYFCEDDLERFAKEAHGDADAVLEKFAIFREQIDKIKNPTGYMIEAIRKDWKKPIEGISYNEGIQATQEIIEGALRESAISIPNESIIVQMTEKAWNADLKNDEIRHRIHTVAHKSNLKNPTGYLLWLMSNKNIKDNVLEGSTSNKEASSDDLERYFYKLSMGKADELTEAEKNAYNTHTHRTVG